MQWDDGIHLVKISAGKWKKDHPFKTLSIVNVLFYIMS